MNWQTPLILFATLAAGLTMAGSGIAGDAPPPRADGRISGRIDLHSDGRVVRLSRQGDQAPQGEPKGLPVGQAPTMVPATTVPATSTAQPHRISRTIRPSAP